MIFDLNKWNAGSSIYRSGSKVKVTEEKMLLTCSGRQRHVSDMNITVYELSHNVRNFELLMFSDKFIQIIYV